MRRVGAMMKAEKDPETYLQLKEEYEEKLKNWHRKTFRAWNAILILTIFQR